MEENLTIEQAGETYWDSPTPEYCPEDSKERCRHNSASSQCRFKRINGQDYCKYHIAVHNVAFQRRSRLKKYKLLQHHMRVDEFVCNPELKNLSEEIGILNFTLETLLNQCHTPWDLQVNQNRIESLIEKIAKTTQINLRLQQQIGKVLDEATLANFIDAVTKSIIDENLPEDVLTRISKKIGESLSRATESGSLKASVLKD